MSDRITLADVRSSVEDLVVTDDFVALTNRAARRLYTKGATPGNMLVYQFGSADAVVSAVPNVTNGGLLYPVNSIQLPAVYSHAASFSCCSVLRPVIPVDATFSAAGHDLMAFVDYGANAAGDRVYALPDDVSDDVTAGTITLDEITALVRKGYADVAIDSDTLPFNSVGSIKLAILAITYEDENDLERAASYWQMAGSELESDSIRYRGPQVINIQYFDAAAAEATETIN